MTPASQTSVGQQIRNRREALGLSVEGLAYKSGVSYKTIERIEAGDNKPRRATQTVIDLALTALEGDQS